MLDRLRARLTGIYIIYGLAAVALGLVTISILGNVVASVSSDISFGQLTLQNYRDVLDDPNFVSVMARTFIQGGGSVLVMLFFAVPIAWFIARTDMPWKQSIVVLLTAQLAIPGFITAMAYVWLFNPTSGFVNSLMISSGLFQGPIINVYHIGWICLLQGLVLVPGCVFMILPAMQSMDVTFEEAAVVNGVATWPTTKRIIIPLLAPAIISASLFYFVIAIELFDFVAFIGLPGRVEVLSLWIYDATHATTALPKYGFAAASGVVLFAVSAVALAFYMHFLRQSERYAVLTSKARPPMPFPLGRWRGFAFGLVGLWILMAVVLPLLTLIWTSLVPYFQVPSVAALSALTAKNYELALEYIAGPLLRTLLIMAAAVMLTLTLSTAASWVTTRTAGAFGRWINTIVFLSPAVPAIVAAVAFQMTAIFLHKWVALYGSLSLVAIAMGTRMIAFSSRTINSAALAIHRELDEAAYASGISRLRAFRRIFLPNVAPALIYSAIMVAMLTARELTLPLMIITGHSSVVATLVFQLQTNGETGPAAAVALCLIIALTLLVFAARRAISSGRLSVNLDPLRQHH